MNNERNRSISFRLLATALLVFFSIKFFSGSIESSCRNSGCVGVGAGTAVLGFGTVFLIMVAATFYASRSFSRLDRPTSILRIAEIWGFWLVTIIALMMTLGSLI